MRALPAKPGSNCSLCPATPLHRRCIHDVTTTTATSSSSSNNKTLIRAEYRRKSCVRHIQTRTAGEPSSIDRPTLCRQPRHRRAFARSKHPRRLSSPLTSSSSGTDLRIRRDHSARSTVSATTTSRKTRTSNVRGAVAADWVIDSS